MAAQLKIKTIELRNFLSYGDYVTTVDLESLGPILIVGRNDGQADKSNGVGKTTITTAIVWCLFGRTPRKPSPGDKILNYFTKKECYVKITTSDGWIITRTRKLNGHDDLLIHKDGDDITLSTNKNAQQLLKKLFNLDFDIFVSSMFFGQKTDSFLEMSDMKRKAAMERMLGLHRLNVWGDVAKERKVIAEAEQQRVVALTQANRAMLERMQLQFEQTKDKAAEFERNREQKTTSLKVDLIGVENQLSQLVVPDVDALQAEAEAHQAKIRQLQGLKTQAASASGALSNLDFELNQLKILADKDRSKLKSLRCWDLAQLQAEHSEAEEVEARKLALKREIDDISLKIRQTKQDLQRLDGIITNWSSKAGTECPACKQSIGKSHTDGLCQPYYAERSSTDKMLAKLSALSTEKQKEHDSLVVERPGFTVVQAKREVDEALALKSSLAEIDDKVAKRTGQRSKLEALHVKFSAAAQALEDSIADTDIDDRLRVASAIFKESMLLKDRKTYLDNMIAEEGSKSNIYNELQQSQRHDLVQTAKLDAKYVEQVKELDEQIKRYEYIRKSYHDRNKIKSMLLTDLMPYLNQRIEYYLNAFECDLRLKFTATLSVETSKWDYDFHSGGQQKRIDLAIMFALYDLYISMYGQQSNVMVLDEIDGGLDAHGVRSFVDVIQNDFSGDRPDKPDTILIISHKNEMVDQFSNQIVVTMDPDLCSHISKP